MPKQDLFLGFETRSCYCSDWSGIKATLLPLPPKLLGLKKGLRHHHQVMPILDALLYMVSELTTLYWYSNVKANSPSPSSH